MAIPLSLQDIVRKEVPFLFNLPENDPSLPARTTITYVNAILHRITRLAMQARCAHLKTSTTFSVASYSQASNLPGNFAEPVSLVKVIDTETESHPLDRLIDQGGYTHRNLGYRISRKPDRITFLNLETGTYRLYYYRRAINLQFGETTGHGTGYIDLAAAPGAGYTSQLADYYNNTDLLIVSDGSAQAVDEVLNISDYAGATRRCTVAFTDQPTASATLGYSLLPWIPDDYQRILAVGAAIEYRSRFPELVGPIETLFRAMLAELLSTTTEGDEATPARVSLDSLYPDEGGML